MEEQRLITSYILRDSGDYGRYVSEVFVYEHQTHIKLYEAETYLQWGFIKIKDDPIAERTIHRYKHVRQTINDMIIDWEIPFYLRDYALSTAGSQDIDFTQEIKKRRAKKQLEDEPESLDAVLHDWLDGKFRLTESGVKPEEPKKYKTNYNEKSKKNLVQYRNK